MAPSSENVRGTPTLLRWIFVPFIALAAAATIVLYIFPGQTDLLFAWTIQSQLTAAMLGAGYAGALALFCGTIHEPIWAKARVAVAAPFTLSTLMLVTTLLHLDRFHLGAAPLPAFVAWLWLIVYVIVPPALAYVWIRQQLAPGTDPARLRPFPAALRIGAVVMAFGLAVVGAVLFTAPALLEASWPWPLTPLTARAVAAWLLGIAAGFALSAIENDLTRLRAGTGGLFVIGLLGLGAVARFAGEVRWQGTSVYVLLAVLAAFVVFGSAGYLLGRHRPPAAAPR